jgi:hypothetical protein
MIPYGDPRKTPQAAGDTERAQVARRHAKEAKGLFGGPASQSGLGLNFRAPDKAPARTTPGGTTTMSFYDSVSRSETAKQGETHDRLAKLPKAIQNVAQAQGVTDLALLEIAGAIHRKSEVYGGERVQVFASDMAKATGLTTQRAEQLIDEAVRRGLIERTAQAPGGGFFRSRL